MLAKLPPIIESVDSISRDDPDMYMYVHVIHYKTSKILAQVTLEEF